MDKVKAFKIFISMAMLMLCLACTKLQVQPTTYPTSSGIRFYGNSYGNTLQSFEATADGGFMFGGYTGTSESNETQGFIQKTDNNGNVEWYKTYGGSHLDVFNTVHVSSDGGYIAVGATASFGNGNNRKDYFYDAWLVKMDANGDTLWQKTFGDIFGDYFYDVAETPDHGFVAVGVINPKPYTYSSTYVVKTDQNGKTMWTRQFFTSTNFYYSVGDAVTVGPNGDIAIAGAVAKSTAAIDIGTPYPAFILLSSTGKSLDSLTAANPFPQYKNWGTIASELPANYGAYYNLEKIISRPDGYILAVNLIATGPNSIMLFKVDFKGNVIWNHQFFGLKAYAFLNDISDNAVGGLLISGGTSDLTGNSYTWLINTDANGNKLWESTVPISGYNAWAAGAAAVGNSFAIGVNLISANANHNDYFAILTTDQNGKIIENKK